jgi:hypothetical protein
MQRGFFVSGECLLRRLGILLIRIHRRLSELGWLSEGGILLLSSEALLLSEALLSRLPGKSGLA